MLNILSTTEKKKVLVEYRLRLAVVAVFAVGALVLASLVLLAPSYFLAVSKYNNAESQLALLEGKDGGGKEKDISTQISSINKKVSLLLSGGTSAQSAPFEMMRSILKIKSSSIKIYGFTYESTASQERIVLTGVSLDRDSLAAFVETLKSNPMFMSVTLPISSYVKSANIDFSVVIERNLKPSAKK